MSAKRKVRTSSSDVSTSCSPNEKRTREDIESASETDEVFVARNMAEDLGKKLEDVLAKLGKLDIIESRLNEVFTSLSNIEQSISRLENDVKTLKVKTKRLDESFKELDESVNFNEENISDLKRDTKAINFEVKELEKQMLYMETYSRRENIKFIGIDEDFVTSQRDAASNSHQQQGENTKEIVYNFMEKELKIKNSRDKIEFQRIHRLGKPNSSKSRPIIARFLRFSDKELVMDHARKNLHGKKFSVFDDIPKPLYEERKKQFKKLKEAREKGHTAYFSKAHPDKLFINGKYFAPDKPLD